MNIVRYHDYIPSFVHCFVFLDVNLFAFLFALFLWAPRELLDIYSFLKVGVNNFISVALPLWLLSGPLQWLWAHCMVVT